MSRASDVDADSDADADADGIRAAVLFPHAGASSTVYRPWEALAAPLLEVRGVDPPGRGMRAREPRADTVEALVESMTDDVVRDLRVARESDPHVRYMMFGHSFGTVLSLCVGAAVARTTGHAPLRAVLSAGLPPRLHAPADEAASLSDEELAAKLLADGGTAAELLSGGALTRYILRLFREDSTIRSQFCRQTGVRVDFPITLISAREDPHARAERMLAWSEHSSVPTRQVVVPGGHFAPVQQPATTIRIIRDAVAATAG